MVERQTAIKTTIGTLLAGEYVQKEGWTPNFVQTTQGEISRANIMGAVVQEVEPNIFLLDDGTGQIRLRTFDEQWPMVVGDTVLVIGRPREYAGTLFLNYEIVKKIDPHWLEYRVQELQKLSVHVTMPEKLPKHELDDEVVVRSSGENLFSLMINIIRELDSTDGAEVEAVLKKMDHPEAQHVLQSLLEEGEVFELRPGKVKVLE